MSEPLIARTNDQQFYQEIINRLTAINANLSIVAKELQTLNANATQKPSITTNVIGSEILETDAKKIAKIVTDELKKSFKAKP